MMSLELPISDHIHASVRCFRHHHRLPILIDIVIETEEGCHTMDNHSFIYVRKREKANLDLLGREKEQRSKTYMSSLLEIDAMFARRLG